MVWCVVWQVSLEVGEDHARLRRYGLLLDVFEARTEAGPAASTGSSAIGSPCSKTAALCDNFGLFNSSGPVSSLPFDLVAGRSRAFLVGVGRVWDLAKTSVRHWGLGCGSSLLISLGEGSPLPEFVKPPPRPPGIHAVQVASASQQIRGYRTERRRLQQLRYLYRFFGSYRAERASSRAGLAPAEDQRLYTAHMKHALGILGIRAYRVVT